MKILPYFLALTTLLLSACESPPKPTPFPKDSIQSDIIKDDFLNQKNHTVPKNTFENKNYWQYSLSTYGANLNHTYHAQLWYLAHHADRIVLVGSDRNTQEIKNKFIKENTTSNILLTPTCYDSLHNKCPNLVNLYFYKDPIAKEIVFQKEFVETESKINH